MMSAQLGRHVGIAEHRDDHAPSESSASAAALPDPLHTTETDENKRSQEHAERWVEESMAREMLHEMTWADYVPKYLRGELYKVFKLGMKYVDEFDNCPPKLGNGGDADAHASLVGRA